MSFPFPYESLAELSGADLLSALGWEAAWSAAEFAEASADSRRGDALGPAITDARLGTLFPARVVAVHRGGVEVVGADGFFKAELLPQIGIVACGDWVLCGYSADRVFVCRILPRFSQLQRKEAGESSLPQVLAANLAVVWIVQGLDGDFNPRRLERSVALAHAAELPAVVVLTKVDQCEEVSDRLSQASASAPGCLVRAVSSVSGEGLAELKSLLLPAQLVAFLGSSGAGKSTLLNALAGREVQKTGAVREDDSRGRHTTTVRRIVPLPGGALLLDTPGIREVGLYGAGGALEETFADLLALGQECRFGDCSHELEPGCAVRQAIDDGRLDEERLLAFRKLQREDLHARARVDQRAAREQKAALKKLHNQYRSIQQGKRRARGRD